MGTVDLRELKGDQIVIHYGGQLTSVDAYTFANSLIAFADTVRSVSNVLDPGPRIEVRLEALGEGSFRAVIKRMPTGLSQFLKRGAESLFFAYIAYLIIDRIHGPDANQIQVNTDEVIITRGKDRIIVPRTVYDGAPKLKEDPKVQDNIARTFEAIEEDDAVQNFGITPHVADAEPLVQVPRDEFPRLASRSYALTPTAEASAGRRERTERAVLVILKLWLKGSIARKWSFEWNGVPISAPIKDTDFLERLARREHLIGYGDALEVDLHYIQDYDDKLGVYVNDQRTFEVIKVIRIIQRESTLDPFIR
jgi:hypothetical protein